MHQESRERPAP